MFGEVAEWLNAPDSKSGLGSHPTGVRISPSPFHTTHLADRLFLLLTQSAQF